MGIRPPHALFHFAYSALNRRYRECAPEQAGGDDWGRDGVFHAAAKTAQPFVHPPRLTGRPSVHIVKLDRGGDVLNIQHMLEF
jgi:hypothetical protein